MKLDPRRVLIFRSVARAGSVSAAARELGWTQPAVSQHLKSLEEEVGTPLFVRYASGVVMNEAGERLLRYADSIASSLQSAESDLDELVSGAGTVRLAAFPSAMADLVPAVIGVIAEQSPAIRVKVTELEPPEALAAIAASDVDLALVFEYQDNKDDVSLATVDLGTDPSFVILPLEHPLAGRRSVPLDALSDEQWVAGCPRCRAHLESLARDAGFVPSVQHETDDFHAAQALVARTGAVTLLPGLGLKVHQRQDVVSLPVDGDRGRMLMLRHRAGAERVPAVGHVVNAVREVASSYVTAP
ncbi:LysR family transcriptional regulator [uncultured Agrococcus sp.]|uniref:LysR family transcriptional regulator n=1 Tax=uncultured Agrococcus sp. TaxID=382258 RepID=UPI0025F95082|nr:LysR family transcriptional regulator [uncultured Agrococcus sp.]